MLPPTVRFQLLLTDRPGIRPHNVGNAAFRPVQTQLDTSLSTQLALLCAADINLGIPPFIAYHIVPTAVGRIESIWSLGGKYLKTCSHMPIRTDTA